MKKAIILCSLDGYANSVKPQELKRLIARYDYSVELFSTNTLNRLAEKGIGRLLPYPRFNYLKLYFLEGCYALASRQKNESLKKAIISLVLQPILEVRGVILQNILSGKDLDLLICENNFDQAVVNKRVAKIQILDLPSPLAEEAFYGSELTPKKFDKLKEFEKMNYSKVDYISFHWHMYANFVKKEKYNGNNFIDLSYGTYPKKNRAHFANPPRIAFLGYLGGYWTNLGLLEKLSKIYPHIDVYGGPRIEGLNVNFKGYAPTLDVLADYQFGLITISDDLLRQNSFSSKHIEYFSYGLPVLVPDWRKDPVLDAGSIYYNADNFDTLIKEYTDEKKWNEKSIAAITIAEALTWERALNSLKSIIEK